MVDIRSFWVQMVEIASFCAYTTLVFSGLQIGTCLGMFLKTREEAIASEQKLCEEWLGGGLPYSKQDGWMERGGERTDGLYYRGQSYRDDIGHVLVYGRSGTIQPGDITLPEYEFELAKGLRQKLLQNMSGIVRTIFSQDLDVESMIRIRESGAFLSPPRLSNLDQSVEEFEEKLQLLDAHSGRNSTDPTNKIVSSFTIAKYCGDNGPRGCLYALRFFVSIPEFVKTIEELDRNIRLDPDAIGAEIHEAIEDMVTSIPADTSYYHHCNWAAHLMREVLIQP